MACLVSRRGVVCQLTAASTDAAGLVLETRAVADEEPPPPFSKTWLLWPLGPDSSSDEDADAEAEAESARPSAVAMLELELELERGWL